MIKSFLKQVISFLKLQNRFESEKGFTIVEVLIVLAIAGLILLIVFEAIPALTRNSRNSQRKHDVSLILDEISNYELRDSDNFPQSCGGVTTFSCFTPKLIAGIPDPKFPNDYFLKYSSSDLTYYNQTGNDVNAVQIIADWPQTHGDPAPNTSIQQVLIYDYEKCDPAGDGKTSSTGADYNNVVALFALEGGNSTAVPLCQQL